jgi:WD40 repeat protein
MHPPFYDRNIWNGCGECVGSQPGHRGAANHFSELNTNLNLRMSAMKGSACGLPMMLSAGADNIVKVWNMKKFKCVSEIQIGTVTGPLTKAAWVGQSVVTASGGNIRLWEYNKHDCYPESSEMKSNNTIFESRGVSAKPDSSPSSEWRSRGLGSHAQTCTDLISTDQYVASSSKSGQIYRWSRD